MAWIRRLLDDSGERLLRRGRGLCRCGVFRRSPVANRGGRIRLRAIRGDVCGVVHQRSCCCLAVRSWPQSQAVRHSASCARCWRWHPRKRHSSCRSCFLLTIGCFVRAMMSDATVRRVATVGPALRLFCGRRRRIAFRRCRFQFAGLSAAVLNAETQAIVIWRYVGLLALAGGPDDHALRPSRHELRDPLALTAASRPRADHCPEHSGCVAPIRSFAFGVVWFFVVLAPSSSVIPLREGMAEHRVYLASAGFFISLAAMLRMWWRRMSAAVVGHPRQPSLLVVAILALLTVRRNQVWSSPIMLWTEATLRAEEMWEPHYALADSLARRRTVRRRDFRVPKGGGAATCTPRCADQSRDLPGADRTVGSRGAGVSSGADHRSDICARLHEPWRAGSSRRRHGAGTRLLSSGAPSGSRTMYWHGCSSPACTRTRSTTTMRLRECAARRGCSRRQRLVSSSASSVTSGWRLARAGER